MILSVISTSSLSKKLEILKLVPAQAGVYFFIPFKLKGRRLDTLFLSQESGVRMNENYREARRNNCRSIFLPLSVQNLSILGLMELKPCTFFAPKRLQPLSVNTFRVNQQALK